MRIRLIAALLMVCVLLLPLAGLAEQAPQRAELVIVLLANDGFGSVDGGAGGSFSEQLELLIHLAEAQGRQVSVYGPSVAAGASIRYVTGETDASALHALPSSPDYDRIVRNTVESLTAEDVAGKDVLLVVGSVNEQEKMSQSGGAVLAQANSVHAVAVTEKYRLQPETIVEDAELTNLLFRFKLIPVDKENPLQVTREDGWLCVEERYHVREYDPEESMAQRLLSALLQGRTVVQQEVKAGEVLILPELMDQPALFLSVGEGADVTLTGPDGVHRSLREQDVAPQETDAPGAEETADTIDLPDAAVLPAQSAPFTAAWNHDGTAVLVSFDASAGGVWSVTAAQDAAWLYYAQKPLDVKEPFVKQLAPVDAAQTDETAAASDGQTAYSLGDGLEKGKAYVLELNGENAAISRLLASGGDQLRLWVESADPGCEALADGSGFQCSAAGEYTLRVSLLLQESLLCTQEYVVSAVNAPPAAAGDIPAEIQTGYWDVDYPGNALEMDLTALIVDLDDAQLTWRIAPQSGGSFGKVLDMNGVRAEVLGETLTLTWPDALQPQGEMSFCLRAEDPEGESCERTITLQPRSMAAELQALRLTVTVPTDFNDARGKGTGETIRFRLTDADGELSEDVQKYLQAYAQVRVGLENQDTAWTAAKRNDDGSYEAEVQYPAMPGKYAVRAALQTSPNAPAGCSCAYEVGVALVANQAPKIARDARGGVKMQLELTSVIKLFSAASFEDADRDSLTYVVTVTDCTPWIGAGEVGGQTVGALPFSFTPERFAVWEVSAAAVDPEGLQSEPLKAICLVIPWYIAMAAGALAAHALLLIGLLIWSLTRPAFPRDSVLTARLRCENDERQIDLHPERWKKEKLPVDRLLACGPAPLIARDTCRQLGRVLIKPTRRGFVLIDKTEGKLLRNVDKHANFDERLYFDVNELSVMLMLYDPDDA